VVLRLGPSAVVTDKGTAEDARSPVRQAHRRHLEQTGGGAWRRSMRRRMMHRMHRMESPRAAREVCVWCGARPLRDPDGTMVTWADVLDNAHCST
jgi:hypothetical protein